MAATQSQPTLGHRLAGRYALIEEAPSAGRWRTYRAADSVLERKVAVHALHGEQLARSVSEAADFSHPVFPQLLDVTEEGGWTYVVTEWVEGRRIEDLLERGAMEQEQALGIASRLADAIAALEKHGLACQAVDAKRVVVDADGKPRFLALPVRLKGRANRGQLTALGALLHRMLGAGGGQPDGIKPNLQRRDVVFGPLSTLVKRALGKEGASVPERRRIPRRIGRVA